MNEYEIAVKIGMALLVIFVASIVVCELVQQLWGWLNDSSGRASNIIVQKVCCVIWKYPVYNEGQRSLDAQGPSEKPFGYAKNKKLSGRSVHSMEHGVDYVYSHQLFGNVFWCGTVLFFAPYVLLVAFKLYALTICIGVAVALAFTARLLIRLGKKFKLHSDDKSIHN